MMDGMYGFRPGKYECREGPGGHVPRNDVETRGTIGVTAFSVHGGSDVLSLQCPGWSP